MRYRFPRDLAEQLKERLATGRYAGEDDVLRHAFAALKRQENDAAAVQLALDDLAAGDEGEPIDAFIDEFRRRF